MSDDSRPWSLTLRVAGNVTRAAVRMAVERYTIMPPAHQVK